MSRGHVVDYGYARTELATWFDGEPVRAFLAGIKGRRPKRGLPTAAFRCESCGYLELYADERFRP